MARFVCVDAETFEVGRAAWPRHHFSHIFGNIVDFRIKKKNKKKTRTRAGRVRAETAAGDAGQDRSACVLDLDHCVPNETVAVLQNGPGFVPSTGRVGKRDLEDVEVGVERMAYSLRWWANANVEQQNQANAEPDTFDSKIWHIKAHGFEQGPKLPREEEFGLASFKREVMNIYRTASAPRPNMSRKDRERLTDLRDDDSVVVKRSDKSNKFVAMKMATYLDKAETILSDETKFTPVNVTIDDWEKQTRTILQRVCGGTLEKDLYQAILPGDNRFPEMYGLPKDHKATVPLRPVVSAVDSPVTNISIVLERILNQCLKYVPAHLKNTLEALEDIRQVYPDLQAPAGTIIVTMDVVVVVVVVEILFCIADQTGKGALYYDGDKVMAESQGYNKQASTKERKTQKTQTANTQKEKREREKKKNKEEESTVESQLSHDSKSKPRCWLTIKINL